MLETAPSGDRNQNRPTINNGWESSRAQISSIHTINPLPRWEAIAPASSLTPSALVAQITNAKSGCTAWDKGFLLYLQFSELASSTISGKISGATTLICASVQEPAQLAECGLTTANDQTLTPIKAME